MMKVKDYPTLEEVMKRIDNASRLKRFWWQLRGRFFWSNLVAQLHRPKWAWQRMRRGWSDRDAWSFDDYLSGVIAGGLRNIRNGHSYPADMEADEWEAYLDEIIDALDRYHNTKFSGAEYAEEMTAYSDAVDAMHRLADRFGNMWD